jgi:hypothetical protein
MYMNFLGRKRLAAFRAHHHGVEHLSALAVLMQQGTSAFVDHVGVAPMYERHHDGIEVEVLLRQDILVAFRRLLIRNAAQDALPNQLFQPFGEQVTRNSKRGLKALEAARAQEAFAENQKSPAVTKGLCTSAQRAPRTLQLAWISSG